MKKYVVVILVFCASFTMAQNVELTGFAGYMLNSDLNTYDYGEFPMTNAANYGGMLSVMVSKNQFVELMYNRTDNQFTYTGYNNFTTTEPIDLAIEYYQIGGLKQIDANEKVKPFGAFTLGATRFHPKEGFDWDDNGTPTSLEDEWAFSATLGAGLKILLSEKIGIRLQARMLLPMQMNGLFVGIGTGGASTGASFHVPMISGDFTGGLIFRLGK